MAKQHYKDNVSLKDRERFSKYLSDDEEIVLVTSYSFVYLTTVYSYAFVFPGVLFLLGGLALAHFKHFNLGYGLMLGLILALIVAFVRAYLVHQGNRYILTTRRVLIKKGFFSFNLQSALYDKITHIEIKQDFMDRFLLHHGTITVNTAGANKDEIVLKYVDHPIELKNLLERLINREREQYGRQTGPVVTVEGEIVD